MYVCFGEFSLDTDTRQLRRRGEERHLSPKAFELLRLLVARRPGAVSKAELHTCLWPSTFVSDATLTSLVAEVRTALGETARHARFVRTVHTFGYAFREAAVESAPRARAEARAWIVWEWGQVALTDGDHLLGRDTDVTVWLESPTVSRHHARLRVSGLDATIEDLGSKNGTYVREQRLLAPQPLTDGDDIRLGSVTVTFRRVDARASTRTDRRFEQHRR
jgi:DNA-binding winged helix-turn-helix (wHTH) protein